MIRCKDCCWYEKKHILLEDGSTRDYAENEDDILGVETDIGINVGGRCKYYSYNNTCWMEDDDFCSKGQIIPHGINNKSYEQLKEQNF